MTDPAPGRPPAGSAERRALGGNIRLGAVIAVAAAIALVGWLIAKSGDDEKPEKRQARPAPPVQTARAVSRRGLRAFARTADVPVHWAGARSGFTYELTETKDGNIYVRYLPKGVAVGARRAYMTISTYPYRGAYRTLQQLGTRQGSRVRRVPGGGIVVVSEQNPKSVYMAFPRQPYQVEVYDPSARRALRLATSGRVSPVL